MESPASPSAPRPIAPVQGFEGRSPIAIRDIPVAFASGCKAVYPAFAPPAYRSLLIFHAGTHAFLVILDLPQAALPGPMFPLASQSAYHWLLYSLKE